MIWPRTPVRDTTSGVLELQEPVAAGDMITPFLPMSSAISDSVILYFIWNKRLNIDQLVNVWNINTDGAIFGRFLLCNLSKRDVERVQYKMFNLYRERSHYKKYISDFTFSSTVSGFESSDVLDSTSTSFSSSMSLVLWLENWEDSEVRLEESSNLFSPNCRGFPIEFLFLSLLLKSFFFFLSFFPRGCSFIPGWEIFFVLLQLFIS